MHTIAPTRAPESHISLFCCPARMKQQAGALYRCRIFFWQCAFRQMSSARNPLNFGSANIGQCHGHEVLSRPYCHLTRQNHPLKRPNGICFGRCSNRGQMLYAHHQGAEKMKDLKDLILYIASAKRDSPPLPGNMGETSKPLLCAVKRGDGAMFGVCHISAI